MNPIEQERERCAKLVENLMKRNKENRALNDKLKDLLGKIRNPKLTGKRGGRLPVQLELPFDN